MYPSDMDSTWGPEPEIVYHYTGWEAFRDIILSKSIRMTHAKFLNDRVELLHGFEFVSNVFAKMARVKSSDARLARLNKVEADWNADFSDFNAFVSSFCERGDTLEQWRAYTPNGGCFIRFLLHGRLRSAAHSKNYWMLPCLYTAADERDRISKIFNWNEEHYAWEGDGTKDLEFFSDYVCSDLMVEIPRFKHYSFRSEREWRLFMFDSALDETDQIGFTAKHVGMVPYLTLHFPPKCVEKIILSPFSVEETKFGTEWFLQDAGFE